MPDQLLRAYARLKALRENVVEHDVAETYVLEYHEILDQVEGTGIELEEFRIPVNQLGQKVTSWNPRTGHKTLSKGTFVAGTYFRSKLDAVLMYFSFSAGSEETPREIGFTPPAAS